MIANLFAWLSKEEQSGSAISAELAASALLMMLATADNHFDERECATIRELIQQHYHFDDVSIEEFESTARALADDSTSLYEFTQLINQEFDYPTKVDIVEHIWKVAYADAVIDKYEEYLIRRVCDLLHLPYSDFIQTRNRVRDAFKR